MSETSANLSNGGNIRVALVTPVFNRRETTLQSLRSLARIDKSGLDVEIIVVDDGSTDGTSQAVSEEFPEVTIFKGDGSLHYAAGTNRGIEIALKNKAEYIVCINDDTIWHDQFLKRLIATAKENPRSIVGGLLLLWDEPYRVFQVAPKWESHRGGWTFREDLTVYDLPKKAFEVEMIVGNCVLYPAEAIRECGLMDEKNFPHGWGDAQYTTRMKKAGWKLLIEPRAYVWNEPNTYPKPLQHLAPKEILRNLFINRRHPANLQRQYIALRESAPSRLQAGAAFAAYVCKLIGKTAQKVVSR